MRWRAFALLVVATLVFVANAKNARATLSDVVNGILSDFGDEALEHLNRALGPRSPPTTYFPSSMDDEEGEEIHCARSVRSSLCSGIGVQRPTEEICASNKCTITKYACGGGIASVGVCFQKTLISRFSVY
jgi:hypothetical protein